MNFRHIACLCVMVVSAALGGCNNADEAKARVASDKTNTAKAADSAGPAKTEKNLGGIAKALQP